MLRISNEWRQTYPDARVGILAMSNVSNPASHPLLDKEKADLETDLRTLFKDPAELKSLEPIKAYQAYYKRFRKTYHVQHQLESVVFKGKSIPKVAALVEAMFMEELRNSLLTAGHDLDLVKLPIEVGVAKGDEQYVRLNGQDQILKAGDIKVSDSQGVIGCIIYGPDRRTMIGPSTRRAMFVVYGVPEIGERPILQHLQGIEANVKMFSPEAQVELIRVFGGE
jgi:DNA/RNA-binding domain of Phe-tRNA-synthetase-like protein